MLVLLGIYIKEYINEAMIGDAASGCDLNYAEAEALDEDEARLCHAKKLEADKKERDRNYAIEKGAKVNTSPNYSKYS